MNVSRIIVKPVMRVSAQKRHMQTVKYFDVKTNTEVDTGVAANKTKVPGCTTKLYFYKSPKSNTYSTGLEEKIDNPFFKQDFSQIQNDYHLDISWNDMLPKIVELPKISLQTYYEILDGTTFNAYTAVPTDSTIGKFNKNSTFLKSPIEEFSVDLSDGANVYSKDTRDGRLAIQLLKNHPKCAINKDSVVLYKHFFYIAEENEEEAITSKNEDLVNEAIFKFVELKKKYPANVLRKLTVVLTDENNKSLLIGEVNEMVINSRLNSYIKDKKSSQADNIAKFVKFATMFIEDAFAFNLEYIIRRALNGGKVYIKDGYVFWTSKMNTEDKYKFTNLNTFKNHLTLEYNRINPKDKNQSNDYIDFNTEVFGKYTVDLSEV